MAIMVRDLPSMERPRERLLCEGAGALSNAELLAVLLRTGTTQQSALGLAEELLSSFQESGIAGFVGKSPEELAEIKGVGKVKAATILAAVELGRRTYEQGTAQRAVIRSPEDAALYAMPKLRYERREHFSVMLLNTKNQVLGMPVVSVGSLTASIVHPREVFHEAISHSAASMILFHNHPSGDPTPSREDLSVTQRLVKVGRIMDVPVVDHIIIGDNRFISMKKEGML